MPSQQIEGALGHYEVAGAVPGRVRLRLQRHAGSARGLASLEATLRATAGVREVRPSGRTSSLIVTYDRSAVDLDDLLHVLQDAGYARRRAAGEGGAEPARAVGSVTSALATTAIDRVRQLEERRLAAPVALGMLSARQVARYGLQLHRAPWYTFAWYAYSLYRSRAERPQ